MAERMEDKPGNVSDRPRKRQYGRFLLDALAEIVLRLTTFVFGFAWWGLKWSVATAIFLAIMAVAGFYVFNEAVANDAAARIGQDSVVVPNVQGNHKDTARSKIDEAGLSFAETKPVPSTKFQRDYVMVQRPEPGTIVRAGRRVFVTLSEGQESVIIPDVKGRKEEEARDAIEKATLTVSPSIARLASNAIPGTVIGQYPLPGQKANRSTPVSLLVSEGQQAVRRVVVPYLVGLPLEDAKARLDQYGFKMETVRDPNPNAEVGVVLKQVPENGREIPEGSTVAVNVRTVEDVPEMREREEVRFSVPAGFGKRAVKIIVYDEYGNRHIPDPLDDKVPAGMDAVTSVLYSNTFTVEFYLDGALVERRVYEKGKPPRTTTF